MSLTLYGDALTDTGAGIRVRYADGSSTPLDVGRWLGDTDQADASLLRRAAGPALDVGCGPGRIAAALHLAGVRALGIDISAVAVRQALGAGAPAARADVFGAVPGVGTWRSVLLVDGNIGIGGNPGALLRRVRELARPTGVVLVETGPPGSTSGPVAARLEGRGGRVGEWFPWARLAADDVAPTARGAGLHTVEQWEVDGRWFAGLRRS